MPGRRRRVGQRRPPARLLSRVGVSYHRSPHAARPSFPDLPRLRLVQAGCFPSRPKPPWEAPPAGGHLGSGRQRHAVWRTPLSRDCRVGAHLRCASHTGVRLHPSVPVCRDAVSCRAAGGLGRACSPGGDLGCRSAGRDTSSPGRHCGYSRRGQDAVGEPEAGRTRRLSALRRGAPR